MKIVLNKCYGGFGISKKCAIRMAELGCKHAAAEIAQCKGGRWFGYGYAEGFSDGYDRTNPYLVQAVEELGDEANGGCAKLRVVDIPDGEDYEIHEYDGIETVRERCVGWSA